ncbi:hypothetical protein CN120_23460 [Sinorhizobium meliloti]|uniref:hypothetical protein n=1 Tax=Rhizobium meliloti TaxID=382 RepID=UPI000FDC5E3B|nr:hypothetical protein [Sinorhizobium meliloti]RVN00449.1 hypothetical protein CN120_23460 [Sinorhizobium meliloti]
MSRACSVCCHPSRPEIERRLVSGVAIRAIASQYGVSRSAVARHRNHLRSMLAEATEIRRVQDLVRSTDLLLQVSDMEAAAIELFNDARRRGDEVAAAAWFDRILKATAFRLSVESARPQQRKDTPIAAAFARQEALAKMAGRLTELIASRKSAHASIEGEALKTVEYGSDAPCD